MEIEIIRSTDKVAADRGLLDVVFRHNPQRATVVTLTRDEVADLSTEVEVVRNGELFEGWEEPIDFEMYSTAGNREVQALIETVKKAFTAPHMDADEVRAILDHGMDTIAGAGFTEVWDTNVRECIVDEIDDDFERAFGEPLGSI